MTAELQRLTKLLAMTTSSSDNECLTAIRKANAMLAARNMTWELFIKGRYPKVDFSTSSPKGEHPTDSRRPEEINHMFEVVFRNASGSFLIFIDSIHEWWEKNGFLTDKQLSALEKAFSRR